jgi:hypothetical protein
VIRVTGSEETLRRVMKGHGSHLETLMLAALAHLGSPRSISNRLFIQLNLELNKNYLKLRTVAKKENKKVTL